LLVWNKKSFSESDDLNEDDFIKISLSPDNKLIPDLHNDLPGKSVWVPANKALIADILRKEDLKNYFQVPEVFASDLGFVIEMILRKKILNGISLTKKAGDLAIGLDSIKTQLINKKHCLILVAKGAKSLKNNSFFSSKYVSSIESLLEQRDFENSTGKINVKYIGIFSKNFKKTIQVDLNKLKGFIDNH
tara:strand:+ start:648 stop:1217 length:570 start_codon:yes stop_codon:yes gene_type:complete